MLEPVRFLASRPELLNAAAPFVGLLLVAAIACAIVAFEAFRELVEAHPSGRRSHDLLAAGIWGTVLAAFFSAVVFAYMYAVNLRAVMNPTCEPVRYMAEGWK